MLELIVVVTVPVDAGREHCELYMAEEPKTNYLKLGRNRRCLKGARVPLRLQAKTGPGPISCRQTSRSSSLVVIRMLYPRVVGDLSFETSRLDGLLSVVSWTKSCINP